MKEIDYKDLLRRYVQLGVEECCAVEHTPRPGSNLGIVFSEDESKLIRSFERDWRNSEEHLSSHPLERALRERVA